MLRRLLHDANLAIHIGAGIVGLALGLVALLATKGAPLHRRFGRWFVRAAAVVVASAIAGIALFGTFPALSAATLAVAYQVTSGVRTLRRRAEGPAPLDTALAAATLAAAGVMIATMTTGNASWPPAIGYPILGWLSTICIFDLSRPLWRATWSRRVWHLDHGIKLTNALFGMMGAGLGNLVPQGQPWTQVGPSIAGSVVIVVLVVLYRR